ncbi:MAG: BMP family ABC transporter substrate-binding protein [Spiroplasma sp.]
MRKTIKILTAILFSTVTSGSIVACTNPFTNKSILRITIVTDGHTITDQSFNESSYIGALQFKEEFEKWVTNPDSTAPDYLRKKRVVISPIQPAAVDLNTLIQSYGQAVVMDSKVTVASGFIQNNALVSAQNGILRNKMRYIYVDGDTPRDVVSYENKNLAGLLYQAEQSGLLAAIASGVWLIANADQYGGLNNLKMSTYGGLTIPAVVNYMYGFYWGMDLLNNSENYSLSFNKELKSWIKILNPKFDDSKKLPKITFVHLPNQFTGNFDQSSRESKALNSILVEKGTNVIFPVAGPQTSDTLLALKQGKQNGKVVGVDTDQQLQYKESADYFLTSALKNINGSVKYMLWRAINYDETEAHNKLPDGEQNKIFKEDAIYRGGKEFVGIANNESITKIYDNIINNLELVKEPGFLEKVSQGWQEVLNNNKGDLWGYGLKVNPYSG